MKENRLIIEASNIKTGGGYILLHDLVSHLADGDYEVIIFLNSHLKNSFKQSPNIKLNYIKDSILTRLKHYVKLPKIPKAGDTLLCFGNLPPFARNVNYHSVVFLQNWFLICDFNKIRADNIRIYFRLLIERIILGFFHKNTDLFLVQTDSMKNEFKKRYKSKVLVQPLISKNIILKKNHSDFYFYPARGDKAKNHKNLIKAWILLSLREIRPKLIITIDSSEYPKLISWINAMIVRYSLNIENIGFVNNSEIHDIYAQSPTIIFPSYFESFGLPLVEGSLYGCDIVAGELDYVRDVCCPNETFNPSSENSIFRAILRHLNYDSTIKYKSPEDFMRSISLSYEKKL